ncbi:hypothetical protein BGZ81_008591 [Podila clonocystis]|nr:hypothetical protein BGZ81_008591 [Podila clonocystis]
MSAISSGSGSSASVIPSAAVISAAAAAVSAGWSECEALTAAMADPDLLLSKVTFNPTPSPVPSSRRRIGSGVSFSSSFRRGSSSKSRSLSSTNESHSPSLPDPRYNISDRLSSHRSPITASPGTQVASASVKNGGTITTFANWMMSHASEPAISDTHLNPGGGVDMVSAALPQDVVAPLSQFPVGEASLAALESSALVLEPVQDSGSQTELVSPPPSSIE